MYQKLDRFPLGAIRAEGFLREQLERNKNGLAGNLYKLEPEMIYWPFIEKKQVGVWTKWEHDGWAAEISGNFWAGYIQQAYTLQDEEMIGICTDWVNKVLKNQMPDGYLGTFNEPDSKIYDDYNAWGTACLLRGLIAFYEATERDDVLQAVYRCLLWFCDKWAGEQKTAYAGPTIIEPMILVYRYIKDQRLIDFCEDYLEFMCRKDYFLLSYKAMLTDELHYCSCHTGGVGTKTRLPALVYTATGNKTYLQASENMIRKVRAKCVHATGSPVSASEYLGPVGSVTETEYCTYTVWHMMYSYMSYITGDAKYGEYMEELFYNGAQGARKKDERAIAYLNSPNQLYATTKSSWAMGDMQVYAPCYPTACCPVMSVLLPPEFIRGLILRDGEDNLYFAAYGPCSLKYGDRALRVDTLYPFRNRVKITLECDGEFALHLRIPSWSEGYRVTVNGEEVKTEKDEASYAPVRRLWKKGDEVEISFEASVKVQTVDDSDMASKFPLSIRYGALVFAYHVPEKWTPIKGTPMTPLPEGWSWFNVRAAFTPASVEDGHEEIGLRRWQYSWNFALDEKLSPADITVEERDVAGYVWENPPILLHTHCYKAPYLNATYQSKTFEPFEKYQYVTDRLDLTLEPYGCTNLRVTYFPKAKLD